jgi:hypothetical protein
MNKEAVRQVLKEYFTNRNLGQVAQRLFPMMTKERIDGILNKGAEFDQTDVMVLVSGDNEIVGNTVEVPQKVRELMEKLRPFLGTSDGLGRH